MGQKRITIEVTEYHALIIAWALRRVDMFTPPPERQRQLGKTIFYRKLAEVVNIVETATEGLSERFPNVTSLSYRKSATQLPATKKPVGRFR